MSKAVLPPEPVQLQCLCGYSGEMRAAVMRCPKCRRLYALIAPEAKP